MAKVAAGANPYERSSAGVSASSVPAPALRVAVARERRGQRSVRRQRPPHRACRPGRARARASVPARQRHRHAAPAGLRAARTALCPSARAPPPGVRTGTGTRSGIAARTAAAPARCSARSPAMGTASVQCQATPPGARTGRVMLSIGAGRQRLRHGRRLRPAPGRSPGDADRDSALSSARANPPGDGDGLAPGIARAPTDGAGQARGGDGAVSSARASTFPTSLPARQRQGTRCSARSPATGTALCPCPSATPDGARTDGHVLPRLEPSAFAIASTATLGSSRLPNRHERRTDVHAPEHFFSAGSRDEPPVER